MRRRPKRAMYTRRPPRPESLDEKKECKSASLPSTSTQEKKGKFSSSPRRALREGPPELSKSRTYINPLSKAAAGPTTTTNAAAVPAASSKGSSGPGRLSSQYTHACTRTRRSKPAMKHAPMFSRPPRRAPHSSSSSSVSSSPARTPRCRSCPGLRAHARPSVYGSVRSGRTSVYQGLRRAARVRRHVVRG